MQRELVKTLRQVSEHVDRNREYLQPPHPGRLTRVSRKGHHALNEYGGFWPK